MTQKNKMSNLGVPHRNELDISDGQLLIIEDDYSQLSDGQRFIVEFFRRKTENKRIAARSDFEPAEILDYLPFISIMDVDMATESEIRNIKVRLFGTALVDFYGEWTGRSIYGDESADSVENVFPDTHRRVILMVNAVIKNRKPLLLYSEQVSIEKPHWKISSMAIPFSKDNRNIDQILFYSELIIGA